MARYPLNLPQNLKQEAETWAKRQGISLNQFILWATAEKVGALNQQIDDPAYPQVTYQRGASGIPAPKLRGTGIRIQTIAIAHEHWGLSTEEIATEYGIATNLVEQALSFFFAHRPEIEIHIALDDRLIKENYAQAASSS